MSDPTFSAELWSDWPGAAGAVRYGVLDVVSGSFSEALDNSDAMTMSVRPDARVPVTLHTVVLIAGAGHPLRGFRVTAVDESIALETQTVRGLSAFADLNTHGLARDVTNGLTTFDVGGRYTPTEFVTDRVVGALAADGFSYWSVGTIDPTAMETITAPVSGWSASQWLRQLADRSGAEPRVRLASATNLAVDLSTRVGASAADVVVSLGKNLLSLFTARSSTDLASAVTVLGDVVDGTTRPASIAENAWTLGAIPGSAPYWIPVTDPAGGAAPIAFDDQCAGLYLLRSDGGTTAIVNTRASDSAVLVAATTGLTAGHHVQFVADASATRLVELTTPNVPRLHRTDALSGARGERNLLRNALFLNWTNEFTPELWTAQGGTLNVGEYPRAEPATFTGITTSGSTAAGAAGIALAGFQPGERLYLGEQFVIAGKTVGGGNPRVGNVVAIANGSGVVSVAFASGTLDALTAAGTGVTMFAAEPKRPTAFPTERDTNDVLRLLNNGSATWPPSATSVRLQSEAFTVKYVPGDLAQLNVACAFTMHNGSGATLGNLDAGATITDDVAAVATRVLPAVMLRNNTTAARLAYGVCATRVANNETSHQVATCSAVLTADTTIDVCILPATGAQSLWNGARYITVSQGTAVDVPPYPGSWANRLWQRSNRILVGRSLDARQLRITLRDLSRVAGYSVTREMLTLGGSILLEDLNVRVRVVSITFDLLDADNTTVLLDSRPTKLLTYLAERL